MTSAFTRSRARYRLYLKSDAWKLKRMRLINRAEHRCTDCGKPRLILQLHHLTYERIYNELDSDLVVLCRACHKRRHKK